MSMLDHGDSDLGYPMTDPIDPQATGQMEAIVNPHGYESREGRDARIAKRLAANGFGTLPYDQFLRLIGLVVDAEEQGYERRRRREAVWKRQDEAFRRAVERSAAETAHIADPNERERVREPLLYRYMDEEDAALTAGAKP